MDFKLTEEQELVRQNVREFAKTYVDPIAANELRVSGEVFFGKGG
jgi:alkylation response protein AidB-like acyl-CoA dehydrogenase